MSGLHFGPKCQLQSSVRVGGTKERQAASMNLVWPSIDLVERESTLTTVNGGAGTHRPFSTFSLDS